MQSQGELAKPSVIDRFLELVRARWNSLSTNQKSLTKKAWSILTYKWRWQIAMNIPYLVIFALDRTNSKVHEFNVSLLSMIVSKIPILQTLDLGFLN